MAPGGSPPGSRSTGRVGPQTPPPAHTVDPRAAEFNAVWDDIRAGMDSIYRHEPMPKLRFVQLYSRVFNYCACDNAAGNFAASYPTLKPGTKRRRDVSNTVMRNDGRNKTKLYGNIVKHTKEHVAAVFRKGKEKMDETLLELYAAEWTQFQHAILVIDRMCEYLNKNCQTRGLIGPDEPNRYPPRDIRTMSLICWRNELLKTLRDPLVNATLRLIRRERRGEPINTRLVQTTVESFIQIGVDYTEEEEEEEKEEDGKTGNQATPVAVGVKSLAFYKSVFEDVFLQDTEEFYAQESSEFLRRNAASEYLKKAELRLEEEQNRVRRYLDESSLAALTAVCRRVLVEKHIDVVVPVVHELLVDEKRDDLGRLYQLVLHVPGGVAVLLQLFARQVELEGVESIQKNCQPVPPDPAAYVDALLQVHKKYQSIVLTSFGNDVSFAEAMDKAFNKFVNSNVVTQSSKGVGTAGARAAELLARYCDQVMKKKTANDNDLEDTLDRLIVLFKYIDERDAFLKFYHKTLGSRLVQNQSTSDESEANMVNKLRQTCGFEYTTKLQKMLTDVTVSRELNDKYRHGLPLRLADGTPAPPSSFLARSIFTRSTPAAPSSSTPSPPADVPTPKVDFNIMIMTSNSWPIFAGSTPINVPIELQKCYESFVRYYNEQYTGRRLQWLFNLSKAEVATNCFAQRYTFTLSTLQLAVLLMYNDADNFSIMQLHEHTGMDMNILQQVVQVMLKSQLLVRSSTDDNAVQSAATDDGDVILPELLPPETVIGLGVNYSSKRLRVNINLPLKAIARKDQEDTHRLLEADRKLVIQAAIVRVMKMRQTIKHQQLMTEVLAILSRRFKAQIPVVKACIDTLIDKEYMKRADDAPDTYSYIA